MPSLGQGCNDSCGLGLESKTLSQSTIARDGYFMSAAIRTGVATITEMVRGIQNMLQSCLPSQAENLIMPLLMFNPSVDTSARES